MAYSKDLVEVYRWYIFIWEHGEQSLNYFHSTIKFTAECSNKEAHFLDVNIKLIDSENKTDFFVKTTKKHQILDSTSYHLCHFQKGVPYGEVLGLSRICSDNKKFDRLKWLRERAYAKRLQQQSDRKADIYCSGKL